MIDFRRSHFTWKSPPHRHDPDYKYPGGFVGSSGDSYHVRIGYEAVCVIRHDTTDSPFEIFLLQPCLAEYTIGERNLFQVPSQEFRVAFTHRSQIPIAARPSDAHEPVTPSPHVERFADAQFKTHVVVGGHAAGNATDVMNAVKANQVLNARTTYENEMHGITVTLEYPIRTINIERTNGVFQVDAGPLLVPDLTTWDGSEVSRVFLAHAAFSQNNRTEFILRREVEPLASERWWWEVRGRDRRALHDPTRPPGKPPLPRRGPTLYNETITLAAQNEVLIAPPYQSSTSQDSVADTA